MRNILFLGYPRKLNEFTSETCVLVEIFPRHSHFERV